ncbi:MAG: DNA methyltransferase [Clostridia bacterium]|nr:site-specific DNA-methyltransferase [Clostridia bacterium]MDH7573865.1 DNA methyltransferase [Clostridia bacterium]
MRRRENRLNDLSPAEWLYWTDTLYLTHYPPDATHSLRKAHGAMKPPEVMAEIIRFFTKERQMVLDPLAGVGGTLLGAALVNRAALGFELNSAWVEVYRRLQREYVVWQGRLVERSALPAGEKGRPIEAEMRLGDCLELMAELPDESVDAVVTDPPYGHDHGASGFTRETNFAMTNPGEEKDFGNASSLEEYLSSMRALGRAVFRVLRPGKYFVLIVGDRYRNREYVPLGFMVAQEMRAVGFRLKGVKIWCNKATQRPLKPYAVLTSFVPNITHQNIIILRKEG